jgi:hypothetical protein
LRELVIKIRSSPQRRENLSNACQAYKIADLKPILDIETRWNSTYEMVLRAIILKNVSLIYLNKFILNTN